MTGGPAAYAFEWSAVWRGLPYLLQGAGLTVLISGVAMVLAAALGLALAVATQTAGRLVRGLVDAYVELFRNTPLLIQIFIVYFGLPQLGLRLSPFLSGLAALVLYAAAYNAEIFRAGLEAVPKGQHEAALSGGLLKNSSLVSTIGMVELMFVANDISFNNFRTFEIYGAAALLYVILVLALTRLLRVAETRMARPA